MPFQTRLTLVLGAVVILNLAMRDYLGSYSRPGFILTIVSLIIALTACWVPDLAGTAHGHPDGPVRRDGPLTLMAAATVLLSAINIASTYGAFIEHRAMIRAANGFAIAGFALCLSFLGRLALRRLRKENSDGRLILGWLVAAIVLGVGVRGSAILASPDPVIDVFAMMRDLTDHLLAGRNPYTHDIVTPYGTPRADAESIVEPPDSRPAGYPPHALLIAAPVRLLRADPRWANVICDALAALALFLIGIRRSQRAIGFVAAAAWLFLPLSTIMIESAWYEPMLGALFGLGLWLAESSGWRRWIGYGLVGFGMTAKQYGVAILPALAWRHRRYWRPMLFGLAVGTLVMLPWFAWSPYDFLDIVLFKHLDRPPQHERALTVAGAWFHLTGDVLPREMLWAVAGLLIGVTSWRGPRTGAATALGLGTALLVFSLFHTQGFFNYFYLVQYLWLLGAVGLVPQTAAEAATREISS
jgi:hypothetical protein